MVAIGEDFLGGRRQLFRAVNPVGLWLAVASAVVLVIANQLLQSGFGFAAIKLVVGGAFDNPGDVIKGFLIGIFPASIVTALAAWFLARARGGNPVEVLNLHWPRLGWLGWSGVTIGFLGAMYLFLIAAVLVLGIDLAEYQPAEGEDQSGSIGLVKQAMFDIAHDPKLFMLVLPSVVIGAPLAEELVFRGQLFTALSQTRLGFVGSTVITSAAWSLMHISEPWFSIAIIFAMGLAFGYLLWRFGSLVVTIVCHGLWNGIYAVITFASVAPS
jgi:uncharacterized protein